MASWYHDDFAATEVFCCTEYTCNEVNIWSHPSYHGEGPWFDWILVHFEAGTVENVTFLEGDYPCKVMSIVPSDCNVFLGETELVVQCASQHTGKDSVLFTEWKLLEGYNMYRQVLYFPMHLFWSLVMARSPFAFPTISGHLGSWIQWNTHFWMQMMMTSY